MDRQVLGPLPGPLEVGRMIIAKIYATGPRHSRHVQPVGVACGS